MNTLSHHSFSSMDTFLSCPRHWFFKYILKESTPPGDAAKFGSQFDEMVASKIGLEAKAELKKAKKEKPIEGVEEAVTTYLNAPTVLPMLKRATGYQTEIKLTPEQWDSYACLHDVRSTILRPYIGFLDLEGTDEIGLKKWTLDLKTSSRREFRSPWAIQGLLYALARGASEHHVHLLTRTKVPAVYRYRIFCTPQLFAWAMQIIGYVSDQIERVLMTDCVASDLPARGGYWCAWCPNPTNCVGSQIEMIKEEIS